MQVHARQSGKMFLVRVLRRQLHSPGSRLCPRRRSLRLALWILVFSLVAPLCAQADSEIDLVYLGGSTGACTGTPGKPA